jgi:hypothetical protein
VVRPTAGDARDQALGRNVRGKKWGEERCMDGGKKWPAACWVGETKERKGKQNKTKEKAGRLLVVGWGERREREREREREKRKKKKKGLLLRTWLGGKKKKKKRPAAYQLAGWEKEKREREREKKKKACCARGWVGERKGRDGKKKKIKIQW